MSSQMKAEILVNPIRIILKVLGMTINEVIVEDNHITAIKDHVIVRIYIGMRTIKPFSIPNNILRMIKDIDDEYLNVILSETEIIIKNNRQSYSIPLNTTQHNNVITNFTEKGFTKLTELNFDEFKSIIAELSPISDYSYVKKMGGIILDADGTQLTITGTNSICLTQRTMTCTDKFKICFDASIKKLVNFKYNDQMVLYTNRQKSAFKLGKCIIFLDMHKVRSFEYKDLFITNQEILIDRKMTLKIISRLSQIKKAPMTIQTKNDMLLFSIKNDNESFFENLHADTSGVSFSIQVDPKYVKIILKKLKDKDITFGIWKNKRLVISDSDKVWVLAAINELRSTIVSI